MVALILRNRGGGTPVNTRCHGKQGQAFKPFKGVITYNFIYPTAFGGVAAGSVVLADFCGVNAPATKFQAANAMFLNASLETIHAIRKPGGQLQDPTVLCDVQGLTLGYETGPPRESPALAADE